MCCLFSVSQHCVWKSETESKWVLCNVELYKIQEWQTVLNLSLYFAFNDAGVQYL